jgi:hypothetical protein
MIIMPVPRMVVLKKIMVAGTKKLLVTGILVSGPLVTVSPVVVIPP